MGVFSTLKAAGGVLKRYGVKTFIKQTVGKLKSHGFEKADAFLNMPQSLPVPPFTGKHPIKKGLVSVVIPCYNHEDYVGQALMSIYRQTYQDIEMVVVDDCSSDASASIIEELFARWEEEKRFFKLTFIQHKTNMGAHASIDEAMNLCRGEYLAVLNSDDYYDENRFEAMIDALNKNGADIGFSKVAVVDKDGRAKKNAAFSALQSNIDTNHMFFGLCGDNLAISSGNLFFKRSLIEKIGLFRDFKYIHDWDFLIRAALTANVAYCDSTVYYYRMHGTNSYLALKGNTALCDSEMTEMRARVFQAVYGHPKSECYSEADYSKIADLLYRRLINSTGQTL